MTVRSGFVNFRFYNGNALTSSEVTSHWNLEKARFELTEAQLLSIKDRIKNWSTKDQVIDLMRYRYGRLEDQAA